MSPHQDSPHSSPPPSTAAVSSTPIAQRLRREALTAAAIFTLMLFGLSLLLIAWRTEQLLTQLSQERVTRLLLQVGSEAERGMRFGVGLADQQGLPDKLHRVLEQEPLVRAVWITSDRGLMLASDGDAHLQRLVQPTWTSALLAPVSNPASTTASTSPPTTLRSTASASLVGTTIRDASGANAGVAWVAFDLQSIREQARAAALSILVRGLPLVAITFFTVWWALQRWSARRLDALATDRQPTNHKPCQHRTAPVIALSLLMLALAPACMVWIARDEARPLVSRQLEDNAEDVGQTLAMEIDRALRLGIPWEHLNGVQALFAQQLEHAPELSYIALRGQSDTPQRIAWSRNVVSNDDGSTALESRNFPLAQPHGTLSVAYSLNYVDGQLRGMMIDLVLAFVIAIVLMRELTRGLWRKSLLHPLLQLDEARLWQRVRTIWSRKHTVQSQSVERDAQLAQECLQQLHAATCTTPAQGAASNESTSWMSGQLTLLRLAVFLIALSEELLRPFFTVFASEVQATDSRLSPSMVAAMPVAAFMATLALTQIAGPSIARRFDLRWSLMTAALVGTCAMAATSFAQDVYSLVALRGLAGIAYGLGFIIAQTAVVRITPSQRRARGLSELSAAIVAAGIVGPPFGGMIAARAGDAIGFAACALCLVAAALVALRLSLRKQAPQGNSAALTTGLTTTGGWRGYMAVLREPRAIFVILGAALPARLVAVTVLSVVVPLYMSALQQPPAVAGRVLLLYFLCFAATSTLIAHWSDITGQRKSFIYLGGLLSVLACVSMMVIDGAAGMALCCALLGFGQAFQSAPQLALATEVFEPREGDRPSPATPEQALAAFRFLERAGSIVAPFVTAIAITAWGYAGAVLAVGLIVGVATLGMMLGLSKPQHKSLAANGGASAP